MCLLIVTLSYNLWHYVLPEPVKIVQKSIYKVFYYWDISVVCRYQNIERGTHPGCPNEEPSTTHETGECFSHWLVKAQASCLSLLRSTRTGLISDLCMRRSLMICSLSCWWDVFVLHAWEMDMTWCLSEKVQRQVTIISPTCRIVTK